MENVQQLELFELAAQQCGVRVQVVEEPPPMSRWERFYTEHWTDAVVWALQGPITGHHEDVGLLRKHQDDILMERLIKLMGVGARHRERFDRASPDEVQDLYRQLGHEWKAVQDYWTNWEVCLIVCSASLRAPLTRSAVEEYKRAFAHCFSMEDYRKVWTLSGERVELIRVEDCKMLRWSYSGRWPPLDEDELEWIADYNARLMEETE